MTPETPNRHYLPEALHHRVLDAPADASSPTDQAGPVGESVEDAGAEAADDHTDPRAEPEVGQAAPTCTRGDQRHSTHPLTDDLGVMVRQRHDGHATH